MKELNEYPLVGMPYFENHKKWVSPMNFLPEAHQGLPDQICLYDVTLRDGEQQAGITFLEDERLRIAQALADLGVERIEAGMPVVSSAAARALKKIVDLNLPTKVFAFARADERDINLAIECGCKYVTIEHSINPYTCAVAYQLDQDKLAERMINSVGLAKKAGLYVNLMGWDFSRTPIEWSKQLYDKVFAEVKPDGLVIVDTYAVASPFAIEYIFNKFRGYYPDVQLEFHTHNDFGLGVGSSLAAVRGGAEVIHCAINGIGERTGNVSTEELACALELLLNIRTGLNLEQLTSISNLVSQIGKVPLLPTKPIVGDGIFTVENGVATHIVNKMSDYGIEPICTPFDPSVVGGRERTFILGKNSGNMSIEYFAKKHNISATKEQIGEITERVKSEARLLKGTLTEKQFLEIAQKVVRS